MNQQTDQQILLFTAGWCNGCKKVETANLVGVCVVDVDANSDVADKYNIEKLPSLLYILGGEVTEIYEGYRAINTKLDNASTKDD